METGILQGGGSVGEVLDRLEAVARDLVGLDLVGLTDEALVELARRSEVLARQIWAGQVRQVREIDQRRLFSARGASSTAVFLRQDLRLSPGQANTRLRVARMVSPVVHPSGAVTGPELPVMADLLDTGELNEECCGIIARFLTGLPIDLDARTRELAEETLVDQACMGDAASLRRAVKEVEIRIDPDGKLAKDASNRMALEFGERGRNGLTRVTGRLDDLTVERLRQAIMGLAAPQPGPNGERDQRSAGQRQGQAFSEMLDRFLRVGRAPSHGGIRPQVMVVMSLSDFVGGVPADRVSPQDWFTARQHEQQPGASGGRHSPAGDGSAGNTPEGPGPDRTDGTGHGTSETSHSVEAFVRSGAPRRDEDPPYREESAHGQPEPTLARAPKPSARPAPDSADACGPDSASANGLNSPALGPSPQSRLGADLPNLAPLDRRDPLGDPALGSASPRASYGGAFPVEVARRLACDARIIPVVLGGGSDILDVGREQRSFPPSIRKAATVRDLGCAFPGCTVPAEWCDGHHLLPWSRGGATSLANCALVCGYHHTLIHQGDWIMQMGPDGRPEVIPPAWIDPYQRPRRNTVHRPDLTRHGGGMVAGPT